MNKEDRAWAIGIATGICLTLIGLGLVFLGVVLAR